MSNNEENKYGRIEYFELREKRLKLVYRILYVAVVLWIAALLCLDKNTLTIETVPFYAAILSISCLVIINIIKYALMEFRCMKVYGGFDDEMLKQTEEKYDRIWNSFGIILSGTAMLVFIHMFLFIKLDKEILMLIFGSCFGISSLYFAIVSAIEFFKKRISANIFKTLDNIGVFTGIITSYSICTLMGLVVVA